MEEPVPSRYIYTRIIHLYNVNTNILKPLDAILITCWWGGNPYFTRIKYNPCLRSYNIFTVVSANIIVRGYEIPVHLCFHPISEIWANPFWVTDRCVFVNHLVI